MYRPAPMRAGSPPSTPPLPRDGSARGDRRRRHGRLGPAGDAGRPIRNWPLDSFGPSEIRPVIYGRIETHRPVEARSAWLFRQRPGVLVCSAELRRKAQSLVAEPFERTMLEGDLPEGREPPALASIMTVTSGMAVQAKSGATIPASLRTAACGRVCGSCSGASRPDALLARWPGSRTHGKTSARPQPHRCMQQDVVAVAR
jgi:hypothetical protein